MTPSTYLIHWRDKGRIVKVDVSATTSDDFGKMQERFATEANNGKRPAKDWDRHASMSRLRPCDSVNGIPYEWGLAGPEGAWFTLIALPGTTVAEIDAAKRELRATRDVVRVRTLKIKQMI